MIVFSATHNPTGRAFVGSSRIELDFHWALLVTQAEEGVAGAFFDLVRAEGGDDFSLSEYGEADSAKGLAQLSRDAVDDLGAVLIKATGRQPVKLVNVAKADDLPALDQEPYEGDDLDGRVNDRRESSIKRAASMTIAVPARTTPSESIKPKSTVDIDKGPLRESKSTTEAATMKALMAGIEARRLSQRKNPPKKAPRRGGPSAVRAAQAAAAAPKKESAAARERRIKAALAEQKTLREADKTEQVQAQAGEMKAILSRLNERAKVAESIRRRR